jgi:hypothetical protein
MIVKPLGGRGGEGIFHVRRDDRNLFSILEQSTRFGTKPARPSSMRTSRNCARRNHSFSARK